MGHSLYTSSIQLTKPQGHISKEYSGYVLKSFSSCSYKTCCRSREFFPMQNNQQCIVYEFRGDLCDVVIQVEILFSTLRNKSTLLLENTCAMLTIREQLFSILNKCCGKLKCLIYKMLQLSKTLLKAKLLKNY